jgi:hypothetical protein
MVLTNTPYVHRLPRAHCLAFRILLRYRTPPISYLCLTLNSIGQPSKYRTQNCKGCNRIIRAPVFECGPGLLGLAQRSHCVCQTCAQVRFTLPQALGHRLIAGKIAAKDGCLSASHFISVLMLQPTSVSCVFSGQSNSLLRVSFPSHLRHLHRCLRE